MGGVLDGQAVSASVTNPAFLDANGDDTGVGKITLANTDPVSGATVDSLQKEHNSAASFMGKTLNSAKDDLPAWATSVVGTGSDSLFDRADALTERFDATTGHSHDGTAGEGPKILAVNLNAVPLRGFVLQGADIIGVTGSSSDVSSSFSGKTPGGSAFVEGVVTAAPENKVIVRQASGVDEDTEFHDAFGNHVYARLTEAVGVWTLSYYSSIAGVETPYSFAVASDVRYYYQEIFNPLGGNAPVYSEFAAIPSDNATADILTATTTLQGKVQLATTAQPVGSSSSAGTANASVANENHTHAGVHSVAKSGDTPLLGDVTLTGSNGTTLTQVGQNIDISSPALATATPSAIASTGSAGSATTTSKSDHTHEGVHAVAASGNPNITGDVTIGVSGGAGISQAGSTITISAPALTSSAAADVGSSGSAGVSTDSARADHVHRGVTSVSKNGSSQLFGNVTLSAGSNVTLTQASQDIAIAATIPVSSTTPEEVASTGSAGVSTDVSRADHAHKGLHSIAKNGSAQLFGDVTLTAGSNVTLTQTGQDITIASTGGGGSLPVGSIVSFAGGYFTGANNTGVWTDVLGNTTAAVNSYIASSGFVVCDGTAPNDPASPIFNTSAKYAPNLTDSRFLQGSTASGGLGGQNSYQISTSNLPNLSLSVSGTAAAASNSSTVNVASDIHQHGTLNTEARIRIAVGGATIQERLNDPALSGSWTTTATNTLTTTTVASSTAIGTASSLQGLNSTPTNLVTVAGQNNLPSHTHSVTGTATGSFTNNSIENRPIYFNAFFIIRIK